MAISDEQRREISRRNGAKSRGPTSDSGKFISSRNSLKHGYYANVHHTPDECPEQIDGLRARYFSDMGPKSVDEEFMVSDCFQGNLRADRVHRAYRALITRQQEEVVASWHARQDQVVGRLWKMLLAVTDAREILPELRSSTLGLSNLRAEWERLEAMPAWRSGVTGSPPSWRWWRF